MTGEFKKFDQGKPEFHIVAEFAEQLGGINAVLEYGAGKYGLDNWKLGNTLPDIRRNKNAAVRHILADLRGQPLDPESGLPHLLHAVCGLLFASWHVANGIAVPVTTEDNSSDDTGSVKTRESKDVPEYSEQLNLFEGRPHA